MINVDKPGSENDSPLFEKEKVEDSFDQFIENTSEDEIQDPPDENTTESLTEAIKETSNKNEITTNDVSKSIITGRVEGNLTVIYGTNPKDPGLPFHGIGKGNISLPNLPHYTNLWVENRIMIASCPYVEMLKLSTNELLGYENLSEFKVTYISSWSESSSSLESILLRESSEKDETIFIVDFGTEVEPTFFFDFLRNSSFGSETIRGELEIKNSLILCLIQSEDQLINIEKIGDTYNFPIWRVPFLESILNKYYTKEESKEFQDQFEKQIKLGLWPGELESHAFFHEAHDFIKKGKKSLSYQFELRERYLKEGLDDGLELDEFLQKIGQINNFTSIVGRLNPVAPYLIFISVNFPQITLKEFNWLVNIIINVDYDPRRIPSSNEEVLDDFESLSNQTLSELWNKYPDFWMKKVFLMAELDDNQPAYVIFEAPHIHRSASKFLARELPFFSLQCFEEITKSGIWLSPNISKRLINGFIQLASNFISKDPEIYGSIIPFKILQAIIKGEPSIQIIYPYQEEDLIFLDEDSLDKFEVSSNGYSLPIIIRLLQEMLKYDHLIKYIDKFFNRLLNEKLSRIALLILIKLRYANNFRPSYWYRQLLVRAEKETKIKAFDSLLSLSKERNQRVFDILEEVQELWPSDKNFSKYSLPANYGLVFILKYLFGLSVDRTEDLGNWPNKFPLFLTWSESKNEIKSNASILSKALFHPGLPHAIREIDKLESNKLENKSYHQIKESLYDRIIGFVEEWGFILLGIDFIKKGNEDNGFIAFEILLNELLNCSEQQPLEKALQRRAQYLTTKGDYTIITHLRKIHTEIPLNNRWEFLKKIKNSMKENYSIQYLSNDPKI